MILKFIYPNNPGFELDLTGKNITIVEENHWFSDQFFTKYTFPLEFDVDDELDIALNMITHLNSAAAPKKFEGYLLHFGGESDAVLIIERIKGRRAQGKFRFGFEEFPNYDKKLSELPLQKFVLTEPMNDYALGIIPQAYPAVNFNFPQIILDSIDTASNQWQAFEGIINNYVGSAFLINEYDAVNDIEINRNIMQPLPYLLHILKTGFADKGLALSGDILEDPEFKQAVLPMKSEHYSTVSPNTNEFSLNTSEYDSLEIGGALYNWDTPTEMGNYLKTLVLSEPGVYKIAGYVILRKKHTYAFANLKINQQEFWRASDYSQPYSETIYTIDKNIEISIAQGAAALNFFSYQLPYELIGDIQNPEGMVVDLTVSKISGFDAQGNRTPSLITPGEIDLTKCVPDITFGELLKVIKNWKNYDIYINQGEGIVEMNKVENLMGTGTIVNLKDFQVKEPLREFYQDKSYILKFQEVNSEEYKFDSIFVDVNGGRTSSFVKLEDTSEITINALPMPLKQLGLISTGHLFIDSQTQVFLTKYDGLTNGLNLCKDTSNLLIPAVYQSSWSKWIYFRIISEGIEWTFKCDPELAGQIRQNTRISAYGKNLIIKRVTKKNISRDYWEIVLECDGSD